jgi:hypothetical protein
MHTKLSQLLPYEPSSKSWIKDGLKEYLVLLVAAEQTVLSLHREELKNFDPLVGENACQIRALKLALVISECSFDLERLSRDVRAAKLRAEQLLMSETIEASSLGDVLVHHDLEVSINENEAFLIKAFLLSSVKTSKSTKEEMPLVKSEYTDTKKIKELGPVGSMFADNLVKKLRRKLAAISVKFVQKIGKNLSCFKDSLHMVSDEFIMNHKGLDTLPCYWTAQVLMRQAMEKQIPIVLIAEQKAKDHNYATIRKTALFFESTEEGYEQVSTSSFDPSKPALILLGTTCRNFNDLPEHDIWVNELLEHSPTEMILAYAATHRQYPDETKDHLFENNQDRDYLYHKEKAHEWGCSQENPSRFFLAHAFCDKIKNIPLHV